ncbi:hypothetical protein [Pseudoduganella sp.]|uniref:hypothetical protein n=1 Tax=Pseudoduganella sp. TaxID=1880898 RepID=UPI0035AF66E7
MTPNVCIAIAPRTLRALMDFQRDHCKEGELCELADQAIHDWLAHQLELAKPAGQRGYFWKALFLPDGTRLRIASHATTRYAAIVGDDLVYNAMCMSPNQFAQHAIGTVHNAWSAIYIQMPGERTWTQAQRLRRALQEQERLASLPHFRPRQEPPAAPAAPPRAPQTALPPAARPLPQSVLLAPQLRHDCPERRHAYRRAEDLLLD